MRAMPSFTSRTEPTSSTSRALRSAASISRRRMSLISPGRSDVVEAMIGFSGVDVGRVELVKNITRPPSLQPATSGEIGGQMAKKRSRPPRPSTDRLPSGAALGARALLVAILAMLPFLPALSGEFLSWDDHANFVANP